MITVGPTINRDTYDVWSSQGKKTAWDRACEEVVRILDSHTVESLPEDVVKELRGIIEDDAQRLNVELPSLG